MPLKRLVLSLLIVSILLAMYGWKIWEKQSVSEPLPATAIRGPAVILFRGDNDPGCQRIYQLVDAASSRVDKRIQFVRQDWSDENPLLKYYQIRFLPSVVFIDQHGQEKLRIVGESPAVQKKLEETLTQLDQLLVQ